MSIGIHCLWLKCYLQIEDDCQFVGSFVWRVAEVYTSDPHGFCRSFRLFCHVCKATSKNDLVFKVYKEKKSLPGQGSFCVCMTCVITKTSMPWIFVWIHLKSQIKFWNLKIEFKPEIIFTLSENLFKHGLATVLRVHFFFLIFIVRVDRFQNCRSIT